VVDDANGYANSGKNSTDQTWTRYDRALAISVQVQQIQRVVRSLIRHRTHGLFYRTAVWTHRCDTLLRIDFDFYRDSAYDLVHVHTDRREVYKKKKLIFDSNVDSWPFITGMKFIEYDWLSSDEWRLRKRFNRARPTFGLVKQTWFVFDSPYNCVYTFPVSVYGTAAHALFRFQRFSWFFFIRFRFPRFYIVLQHYIVTYYIITFKIKLSTAVYARRK
jgi:hypothetical protein